MLVFPAIDLVAGQAVRLFQGDYAQKTVYSDDPLSLAQGFAAQGAQYLHVVDLEGARDAGRPNFSVIANILRHSGLSVEVGGGIRSEEDVQAYLDAGAFRVILGTTAVTDPPLLERLVSRFGAAIAVGADIRDGQIAIKGWTERSAETTDAFFSRMRDVGVQTVVCTDISRDGAMRGTNRALYKELSARYAMQLVASGGISHMDDVQALCEMGIYGAILGKALYTGDLELPAVLELARKEAQT